MPAIVIIPARLGSTRFPRKMLAAETGRPLVQHVVDRVKLCKRVSETVVATDSKEIVTALRPFGTACILTSPTHQSGTDRIAEVMRTRTEEIIVNVQGDEPEIEPEIIDGLIARLETHDEQMATAATPFREGMDPGNPNLVKVIMDENGRALYFSRSPIPHHRDPGTPGNAPHHLHLGIYAYHRDFLLKFASWKPTPLELTEKLEQLRALEHGTAIWVMQVNRATHGIDTAEQYAAFVQRCRGL